MAMMSPGLSNRSPSKMKDDDGKSLASKDSKGNAIVREGGGDTTMEG